MSEYVSDGNSHVIDDEERSRMYDVHVLMLRSKHSCETSWEMLRGLWASCESISSWTVSSQFRPMAHRETWWWDEIVLVAFGLESWSFGRRIACGAWCEPFSRTEWIRTVNLVRCLSVGTTLSVSKWMILETRNSPGNERDDSSVIDVLEQISDGTWAWLDWKMEDVRITTRQLE